jgi:hypothetical protein
MNDERTDRHFTSARGLPRKLKRAAHEAGIYLLLGAGGDYRTTSL